MTGSKQFALAALTVVLTATALLFVMPDTEKVGCVARSTIISRGQDWVDKGIPYDKTYDQYRTDCSGFVSMAWGLPRPGHTTSTLGSVSREISKGELQSGDVLLNAGLHVAMFVNWNDGSRNTYLMMEESAGDGKAVKKVCEYPFYDHK